MEMRPDFMVIARDGSPKLVVEVKTTKSPSPAWASEFRKNLLENGFVPPTSFFLLASPEQLYLWAPRNDGSDLPPDFVVDSKQALAPWLSRMNTAPEKMSEGALELLIHAWLSDVMTDPEPRNLPGWLRSSGLYAAIKGARLRSQATH